MVWFTSLICRGRIPGEEAIRNSRRVTEVEAVVLAIDTEKERISLGIKQLDGDPYTSLIAIHEEECHCQWRREVGDARGAIVTLAGEMEGYLRASGGVA